MSLKKILLQFLAIVSITSLEAQISTSTITGTVVDQQSGYTIPGATVLLKSSKKLTGTTTDIDGKFKLENIPVGRHIVQINFLGYEVTTLSNLLVSSAKELNLNVQLIESIEVLSEVVITASANKIGTISSND